jgi:hypothetical protein
VTTPSLGLLPPTAVMVPTPGLLPAVSLLLPSCPSPVASVSGFGASD